MIHYAITEGGHPFNGSWLKVDLPTRGINDARIVTDKGVIAPHDPVFSKFASFHMFYGLGSSDTDWYQRFYRKHQDPIGGAIGVAKGAWDVLQHRAQTAQVLSIENSESEEVMAKRSTKAKPETTAQAMDQEKPTAKLRNRRRPFSPR